MEVDWGSTPLLKLRRGKGMALPDKGHKKAVVPGMVPSHQQGAAGETWPGLLEEVNL